MQVDETGCHEAPLSIKDRLALGDVEARSDLDDASLDDADVDAPFARPVDRGATANEKSRCGRLGCRYIRGTAGFVGHAGTPSGSLPAPRRSNRTAMRTAIPLVTCSVITDCVNSPGPTSISTPRFIGPGCMTRASGLARAAAAFRATTSVSQPLARKRAEITRALAAVNADDGTDAP